MVTREVRTGFFSLLPCSWAFPFFMPSVTGWSRREYVPVPVYHAINHQPLRSTHPPLFSVRRMGSKRLVMAWILKTRPSPTYPLPFSTFFWENGRVLVSWVRREKKEKPVRPALSPPLRLTKEVSEWLHERYGLDSFLFFPVLGLFPSITVSFLRRERSKRREIARGKKDKESESAFANIGDTGDKVGDIEGLTQLILCVPLDSQPSMSRVANGQ